VTAKSSSRGPEVLLTPAILALSLGSLLICGMLCYAASFGAVILRDWDLHSGSELQLRLERRTYLISTLVGVALIFQFLSFFLFIYTADRLAPYFTGAMCAAGSLNANGWGYPVLVLKLLTLILAGLWLIINWADNGGYDYPLIRVKYRLLLGLAPLVVAEAAAQWLYFWDLRPNIITSCCGSLFSASGESLGAEVLALPPIPMLIAGFLSLGAVLAAGLWFFFTGKGGYLLAGLSLTAFIVAGLACITAVSLYIYELPTHHCPFCFLQWEYWFVGYPIYLALLVGVLGGVGAGLLSLFRDRESLAASLPALQNRLALAAIVGFGVFGLIAIYQVVTSHLIMS
jgi:hypothetical protein